MLIFALGLLLTAGTLSLLGSTRSAAVEMVCLVAANLAATVLRFGLLKVWVFRSA